MSGDTVLARRLAQRLMPFLLGGLRAPCRQFHEEANKQLTVFEDANRPFDKRVAQGPRSKHSDTSMIGEAAMITTIISMHHRDHSGEPGRADSAFAPGGEH
jgi:hypothetical protein